MKLTKIKIINEQQAEIDKLNSIINEMERSMENANPNMVWDTIQMPRDLSVRQKMVWCGEPRNDGSGKLNRVMHLDNGCIIWTGRKKSEYGIIDINYNKYRTHTLAKVITLVPEIELSGLDDLAITAEYKRITQIEKLVGAHQCHNKACINPDHIEFKTNQENRMESFYTATQTKGNEFSQKLVYDFFLELTDYKNIKLQLHEYTKEIGLEVAVGWAYNLTRGLKYLSTPLGQEYKQRLKDKWTDIAKKNKMCKVPSFN